MEEFVTVGSGWPDLTGKTVFAWVATGASMITLFGKVWDCNERGFGIDATNPGATGLTATAWVHHSGDREPDAEEGIMWIPWHALAALRLDRG